MRASSVLIICFATVCRTGVEGDPEGDPMGEVGYTPAPPYHPPTGYAYTPRPPPPYASPYAQYPPPKQYPPPGPDHGSGPPACLGEKAAPKKPGPAGGAGLANYCLEDGEYPSYEIQHAVEYHYSAVAALYKDVLANTENSVDGLAQLDEETSYLCPARVDYVRPLRALNADGKWRIVVNNVKAHYETLSQTARVEHCLTYGESCPLVPPCYATKCVQKSVLHRFLVYDPYDYYFPFAIESFPLPSSCACYNGHYYEPVLGGVVEKPAPEPAYHHPHHPYHPRYDHKAK